MIYNSGIITRIKKKPRRFSLGFFSYKTGGTKDGSGQSKVNVIVRTCPKASLFAAFRSFGIERR